MRWQMPQGGIDDGERPRGGLRELLEEIGTNAAEIVGETEGWLRLRPAAPPDRQGLEGQVSRPEARNGAGPLHRQGRDIDLATEHPEFDAWQWVEPDSLSSGSYRSSASIYEAVVAEFSLCSLRPYSLRSNHNLHLHAEEIPSGAEPSPLSGTAWPDRELRRRGCPPRHDPVGRVELDPSRTGKIDLHQAWVAPPPSLLSGSPSTAGS